MVNLRFPEMQSNQVLGRDYDLGRIVNRTLVYLALTVTLGAVYLGLVLLIGLTLGTSNVAIAVSTLAVAALFRPLAIAHPGRRRPPLLPPPLRRRTHAAALRQPAARASSTSTPSRASSSA